MSWWDSKAFSGFASQALKKAQKGIDKMLDINEEEGGRSSNTKISSTPASSELSESSHRASSKEKDEGDDFFNAWLSSPATEKTEEDSTKKQRPKSASRRPSDGSKKSQLDSIEKRENRLSSSEGESAFTPLHSTVSKEDSGNVFAEADTEKDIEISSNDDSKETDDDNVRVKESKDDVVVSDEIKDDYVDGSIASTDNYEMDSSVMQEISPENVTFDNPTSDMFQVDQSQSDWSDMSLSLLTESQMGLSVTKTDGSTELMQDAKPVLGDLDEEEKVEKVSEQIDDINDENSAIISDETEKDETDKQLDEKTETQVDLVKENVTVEDESVDIDKDSQASYENIQRIDKNDESLKEQLIEENKNCQFVSKETKKDENTNLDISVAKSDDNPMEESRDSGEMSDSNKTITADDVESDVGSTSEEIAEHDRYSDTEPKDTDSCQDRSSSIQSLTEPSISSSPQSPDASRKTSVESRCKEGEMSSSGYVKNMLEEAMAESLKDTDSHADSCDLVRIDAGHNSDHTSADEIETTTSSDIEIISHLSTPSNGEHQRPFDLSPLRHVLGRSMTVPRSSPHARSDSGSSHSTDPPSPPSAMIRHPEPPEQQQQEEHQQEMSLSNNPLETEKLLKDGSPLEAIDEVTDPDELLKKLADLAATLEARERKVLELSQENVDLVESNNVLKNLLKEAEEAREADQTDLHALTEEFTKRIAEAEKRSQTSQKEKEQTKKRMGELELELTRRSDTSTASERIILEKDEQINELLEEGEKLSKQLLQSNNIIKKLRTKERDSDNTIKTQKEKLESQKAEIERLQKILDNKCDIEQKQIDAINQLNNMVKKQEKEIDRLKSDVEDYEEKARSAKNALDSSYKEIAELHKAAAAAQSEQTAAALSAEMQAKQVLQKQLEQIEIQSRQQQEGLISQIEELRLSLSRQEKEHGRREDLLRQDICDTQQRLQEAEERNHELTHSVTAATRPLLRQIENLQATYSAQAASYEKVEKNLTDRLTECQHQLAMAQEKERGASERLLEVNTRLSALESQSSSLRQEKSRLMASLEVERAKVQMLEDSKNNEVAQLEAQKYQLDQDLQEIKKEKVLLENQLEMEKLRVEAEKKKVLMTQEQLRDKELQLSQLQLVQPDPSDSMIQSVSSSMSGSMTGSFAVNQDESLDRALMMAGGSKMNLYESLRQSGGAAATLMENLQSQLKQREGEIAQLQSEIVELEKTRESMAKELVILSNKNDELEEQLKDYPEFKKEYKDLDKRYNAMLQMYGEKVEEADELRLDLQDVKEMYKGQIEELLKKRFS